MSIFHYTSSPDSYHSPAAVWWSDENSQKSSAFATAWLIYVVLMAVMCCGWHNENSWWAARGLGSDQRKQNSFFNISIHSVSVVCVVWDETLEVVIFNFSLLRHQKFSFFCVRDVFFFYNNRNSGSERFLPWARASAQTSAHYDFFFSLDAISHACDHHNVSKAAEAELGTQKTQHTESLNLEWDGRKFIVGSTWWCDCCGGFFFPTSWKNSP